MQKKVPYGENFKIDSLIENDRLQFKLTEYEVRVWYRAYILKYRLLLRKEKKSIVWTIWRFKWRYNLIKWRKNDT